MKTYFQIILMFVLIPVGKAISLDSIMLYNLKRFEKQHNENLKNFSLGNHKKLNFLFEFKYESGEENAIYNNEDFSQENQYTHEHIYSFLYQNTESALNAMSGASQAMIDLNQAIVQFENNIDLNIFDCSFYVVIFTFDPLFWKSNLEPIKSKNLIIQTLDALIEADSSDTQSIDAKKKFEQQCLFFESKIEELIVSNAISMGNTNYSIGDRESVVLLSFQFLTSYSKNDENGQPEITIKYFSKPKVKSENSEEAIKYQVENFINQNAYLYSNYQGVEKDIRHQGFEIIKALQSEEPGGFWDSFTEATPELSLLNHLKNEPLIFTKHVSFEKRRLAVIKIINGDEAFNEKKENALIKLLVTIQAGEADAILSAIEENNGIKTIFDNFHDYWGENNFTGVVFVLSAILERSGNKLIAEDINGYFDGYIEPFLVEGDILKFDNLNYEILDNNRVKLSNGTINNSTPEISYKDYVGVKFAGSLTVDGNKFEKGTIQIVPAIQAILFSNTANSQVNTALAWIALDVGSLFVGFGGITGVIKGANYLAKGAKVLDIVTTAAGVAVQLIHSDAISEDLRTKIQIATMFGGFPEIIHSIPRIGSALDEMHDLRSAKTIPDIYSTSFDDAARELSKPVFNHFDLSIDNYEYVRALPNNLELNGNVCNFVCKMEAFGCFSKETEVLTETGLKALENINVGDEVYTFNHNSKIKELKKVASIKKQVVNTILMLILMSGDTVWATPNHPFFVRNQYLPAEKLSIGDELFTIGGESNYILSSTKIDTSIEVHNLTIPENENYFIAPGVLVHNTCFLKHLENFPAIQNRLNNLPEEAIGQFLVDFRTAGDDVLNVLAKNDGSGVRAWESVSHLKPEIRLNTTILGKIYNLRSAGNIPTDKLDLALKNQLGEILHAADNANVNMILDQLGLEHVNETHFNYITQRLNNYSELKTDLVNQPNWFETFDDILDNPEKYWDILGEGNIPAGTPLAKWGQGYWWKNLRELSDEFERLAALDKIQDIFGSAYGTNITLKVTNNIIGEIREIIPDFLAFKNGKYFIADAKYTTKSNFIIEDAVTPNQGEVFQWIKDQVNITVEVRSPNSKLENIPGLNQGDILPAADLKIDILKSKKNDNSVVESVINYY